MSFRALVPALAAALVSSFAHSVGAQAPAQPLAPPMDMGRVFLTPEQRNALDARRRARVQDKPAATAVQSPYTSVNGFVARGGKKSTVWINGEALPEGSSPEGLRVLPRRNEASRVTLGIGETETQVDLKIGQSFDRTTGEVRDPLQGGEVKVNRAPAQRAR